MSYFIISDNEGFTSLAEFLHTRIKTNNTVTLMDEDSYVQPIVGKTVVISIDEAIASFKEQVAILHGEHDSIDSLIKELSKVRLPINREIDRKDIDSDKVIELVKLQDEIVQCAIQYVVHEINEDNVIALQRVLNLHRHTLDGSMGIDHPIEIVREVVEHSMKQLYVDEKFIEENSQQVIMDPYHKSIRDQITLIEERLLDIENEVILPTDGSEYFVAKMVELGSIRRGLTIRDSGSDRNEVFKDLCALSEKINNIFVNGYVSHLNDNYIKLVECQHFPIKRAPTNNVPEVTPTQKVLGISLAMVACGAVIGGFKYFFDN